MITFDRVSKRYGERLALDDISWHMDEGDCVTVVGPSGAGKTSFLRLITHETQPSGGHVTVGTFKGECYAVSFDPKPGTPGAGWAIAATKETAEERALENCKATAGAARREFCKIEESKCDEN